MPNTTLKRKDMPLKSKGKQVSQQNGRLAGDVEVWLSVVARVVARIAQQRRPRKAKA